MSGDGGEGGVVGVGGEVVEAVDIVQEGAGAVDVAELVVRPLLGCRECKQHFLQKYLNR